MRVRVVLFGVVGTLATLFAAGLLFAPELLETLLPVAPLVTLAEATNTRQLLLLGSVLVGLTLTLAARSATRPTREGEGGDAFDAATAEPPEAVTTARQRRTAAELQATIDEAVAGDEEALDAALARLRGTVADAYAQRTGCSIEDARQAVATGEWTDDRTAAAALARDDTPTFSLWSRLRLWLDPEAERRRRLNRTVRAARGLAEGWR
jgi:hypothetical protein